MNSITDLLNLEYLDIIISDIQIQGTTTTSLWEHIHIPTFALTVDLRCIPEVSRNKPLIIPSFRTIILLSLS